MIDHNYEIREIYPPGITEPDYVDEIAKQAIVDFEHIREYDKNGNLQRKGVVYHRYVLGKYIDTIDVTNGYVVQTPLASDFLLPVEMLTTDEDYKAIGFFKLNRK